MAHDEIDRRLLDWPAGGGIEADELGRRPDHPVPRHPELGEDHVAARDGEAPHLELAQVVADAAGELEHAARGVPVRFEEREAGEEGRVAPAMQEVVGDGAEGEVIQGLAKAQGVSVANEPGQALRRRPLAAPPGVLVGQEGEERLLPAAAVEHREDVVHQLVPAGAEVGDAVDHRPARPGSVRERVGRVGFEPASRCRRDETEGDHGREGLDASPRGGRSPPPTPRGAPSAITAGPSRPARDPGTP